MILATCPGSRRRRDLKVAPTRKAESDAYQHAERVARQVRISVAEQLAELLVDATGMGSRGELVLRLQNVVAAEKRIESAQGQQIQAREMGLPLRPGAEAEKDAKAALRQATMELAEACGCWVAAMDFELIRETDGKLNGSARARGKDDSDAV
jgi:predicted amino acid dehydrogenase